MNRINKKMGFTPLEIQGNLSLLKDSKAKPPNGSVLSITKSSGKFLTGFTLIETVVALTIFVIISITLGGVVTQMAILQERIVGRNQQISELRFALDYISNSVVNARNPPATGCIVLANANFEVILVEGMPRKIRFVNAANRCQEISLSPLDAARFGRIRTRISTDHTSANLAAPIYLTSNIVTRFDIHLIGHHMAPPATPNDRLQPRITISIASNIPGIDLPITTQRSVSRIKLDN